MALWRNRTTGNKLLLKSHHIFGRNKTAANTILTAEDVSQIHAAVRWDGFRWGIKDLSRNGTWLDQDRLAAGKSAYPEKGDIICFGTDATSSWEVMDLDPPVAALVPMEQDGPVIAMKRFHVLPDEDNPEISIYISDTGQWVCENENRAVPLHDGDIVRGDSGIWQFFNADPVESTLEWGERYVAGDDVRFHFNISTDEEHVFLKIIIGDTTLDLGERAHHYLLLTLARLRLQDAENGDDPSNQGWVASSRLSDLLGLDPSHLNIQIYRARKQVYGALPDVLNPPMMIDRRVGSLRFGCTNFQIVRGSHIEGSMP